jgi:thiamine-monophosphate kinase
MAAMGGVPRHFLLSLAIPVEWPVESVDSLIDGMLEMGAGFELSLIGGDISSSPGGLVVSVTLLGEQSPDLVVTRSGARPGDFVCVTGTLGDSALGLSLLKKGIREGKTVRRHLDPVPRVKEGIALAEAGVPSAMIDISDGLLADLGHILELSCVGARLFLEKLPLSDDFLSGHKLVGEDLFSLPLGGGEDYELLLTVPPDKIPAAQSVMRESGTRFTVIGEITASSGLSLVDAAGAEYTQGRRGFNHFSY